jgi:hypothetical protein
MRARVAALIVAIVVILFSSASVLLIQNAPPAKPAPMPQAEQSPKPNPVVARAWGTMVKATADMFVSGAYACYIKPGCNFCPLAADKCPCRSNVKTPVGVCGECRAGWEAGVGAVEGVQPQNVQQIKGDMLKMMYSMREPRERMASGRNGHHH